MSRLAKLSLFVVILLVAGWAGARDLFFLVWSDSHFGAFDASDTTRLGIMEQMNALAGRPYPAPFGDEAMPRPALLLHCGDITENGRASQWDSPELADQRSYLRTVGRLDPNIEVYEALGNHDSRAGENVRAQVAARQGNTYYSFDKEGVHFVVLDPYPENNTTAPRLDGGQLAWLGEDLGRLRGGTPIVVAIHINPDWEAGQDYSYLDKESSEGLYRLIGDKNVVAIFHGHWHRSRKSNWRGIDLLEPAGYAYWPGGAHEGYASTFGLVRIQDDRLTIWQQDWQSGKLVEEPFLDKPLCSPDSP